jgi:hypothetical protein
MPISDNEDKVLGYQGYDIPEEYMVVIRDQRPANYIESQGTGVYETSKYKFKKLIVIRGLLQHDIDIKTTAQWSPLSAANFASKFATEVTQLVSGRTLITKWGSRQVWMGTSPLDFTINLRFEAINDPESEVLEPCRELQRMILPYTSGKHGDKLLMFPPGPLATGGIRAYFRGTPQTEGEIISVRIGKLLKMSRVIIRDINHTIMNRFEEGGNPVSANVAIHFQTFEVLTKNSLEDELYCKTKVSKATPLEPLPEDIEWNPYR